MIAIRYVLYLIFKLFPEYIALLSVVFILCVLYVRYTIEQTYVEIYDARIKFFKISFCFLLACEALKQPTQNAYQFSFALEDGMWWHWPSSNSRLLLTDIFSPPSDQSESVLHLFLVLVECVTLPRFQCWHGEARGVALSSFQQYWEKSIPGLAWWNSCTGCLTLTSTTPPATIGDWQVEIRRRLAPMQAVSQRKSIENGLLQ
jgi:hypothetical protein